MDGPRIRVARVVVPRLGGAHREFAGTTPTPSFIATDIFNTRRYVLESRPMRIPEALELSSAALGAVFVVAWIVAVGVALYRYDRERITRRELTLAGGGALI